MIFLIEIVVEVDCLNLSLIELHTLSKSAFVKIVAGGFHSDVYFEWTLHSVWHTDSIGQACPFHTFGLRH